MIALHNADCLEIMKGMADYSVDLLFCDPPYALGSEVVIKANGKPDYKKAVDFMAKWEQPDGEFWEQWFKEVFRILKHGGRVLMFGMDRQLFLNCYYANFAGFIQQQSLYWFFISSFPKSTDLSKQLDKHFKAEREVLKSEKTNSGSFAHISKTNAELGFRPSAYNGNSDDDSAKNVINITAPATDLAKKYDGYKYGIAPLKQTNETILVFQKPCKTGSPFKDVLAMENGNDTITASIVDIENNRVATSEDLNGGAYAKNGTERDDGWGMQRSNNLDFKQPQGRFPAQTFVDSGAAERLDFQSGLSISTGGKSGNSDAYQGGFKQEHYGDKKPGLGDIGGCSKILHKCDFDKDDHDLYFYCPKVSGSERNEAIDNNHPTLKPISLLVQILRLFKTPNPQVLLDPFMGSGSMAIAANKVGGFDYVGVELNDDYFSIAQERIAHAEHDLINMFGK